MLAIGLCYRVRCILYAVPIPLAMGSTLSGSTFSLPSQRCAKFSVLRMLIEVTKCAVQLTPGFRPRRREGLDAPQIRRRWVYCGGLLGSGLRAGHPLYLSVPFLLLL
jgi:hypothetical protein